jgi:tetratricopeptide (TPR) repeat protein
MKPFFPRLNHGLKLGDLLSATRSIQMVASGQSLVFLIGLVLIAVTFSVLVVPRGRELALLDLEVGNKQAALNLLEQMFEAGDRSPPTVAALAKVRARSGDVAGSIQLLAGQLSKHPRDIGLLQLLADQLQQLSRTEDYADSLVQLEAMHLYADILVRLEALHPTSEVRRELAHAYEKLGLEDEQARVLHELVYEGRAEVADYLALARVEGNAGRPAAGAEVLQLLAVRHSHAVDASIIALEMALLVSAGQADQAIKTGRKWLIEGNNAAVVLAGALISVVDPERAFAVAETIGLKSFPPKLLGDMARAALATNRMDIVQRIRREGGDSLLSIDPVLTAQIFFAMGDRIMAQRWCDLSAEQVKGEPVRAVQIAEVELRLGRRQKAVAALRQAVPFRFVAGRLPELTDESELLHPSVLVDVARIYIRLGLLQENLAVMDALRRRYPSAEAEMAWALAAAGAGRASELSYWLQARKVGSIKPEFLKEITFVANHANARSVAAEAARRLVATRGNDSDRMLMAEVFGAAGLPWRDVSPRRSLPTAPRWGPIELWAKVGDGIKG